MTEAGSGMTPQNTFDRLSEILIGMNPEDLPEAEALLSTISIFRGREDLLPGIRVCTELAERAHQYWERRRAAAGAVRGSGYDPAGSAVVLHG
jgi:hypothetical protein